jgi:hypothetical protein
MWTLVSGTRATLDLRAAGRDLEQARGVIAVVEHPAQLGSGRQYSNTDASDGSDDCEEHVLSVFLAGASCDPLECAAPRPTPAEYFSRFPKRNPSRS